MTIRILDIDGVPVSGNVTMDYRGGRITIHTSTLYHTTEIIVLTPGGRGADVESLEEAISLIDKTFT